MEIEPDVPPPRTALRKVLRVLGYLADFLSWPIGLFIAFMGIAPADHLLVVHRVAVFYGIPLALVALVLVRGKFTPARERGRATRPLHRIALNGNIALLGGSIVVILLRLRGFGHFLALTALLDHSPGQSVTFNLHDWKDDRARDTRTTKRYLEVSFPESPDRRMYIGPYEGHDYVQFDDRPPKQVTAIMHRGALGIPWVETKSLVFRQHLYEMQYVKRYEEERGSVLGYMDDFRGRLVLIVKAASCRKPETVQSESEILDLRAKYSEDVLTILGEYTIEEGCSPKNRYQRERLLGKIGQSDNNGVGAFLTVYYDSSDRHTNQFRSFLFDKNGNFVGKFGGHYRFEIEKVEAAIRKSAASAVLRNHGRLDAEYLLHVEINTESLMPFHRKYLVLISTWRRY